jgi:hypothetical protein
VGVVVVVPHQHAIRGVTIKFIRGKIMIATYHDLIRVGECPQPRVEGDDLRDASVLRKVTAVHEHIAAGQLRAL